MCVQPQLAEVKPHRSADVKPLKLFFIAQTKAGRVREPGRRHEYYMQKTS